MKSSGATHTVMPKKLAEALMEAGVNHFSAGGVQGPPMSSQNFAPGTPVTGQTNGNLQGVGFQNSTNPSNWFDGSHNSQTTSTNGVQPTQTFGQHTADQLGLGGWGRDAASQMDSLQGMNLYNAQAPDITRQNFAGQIAGTRQAQTNAYMAQNNLASQLLAQSKGQGPNIAQTQLANATGQNVQQQGALMASQRGANANPALMARQASMQGAAIQQNAAGQSAGLQAQQQLAAQQALGTLYQQQAGNALNAEQIQQQALANQNNAINTGGIGAQQINANASQGNANRVGGMQSSFTNSLGGFLGLSEGGDVPDMMKMPDLIPYQKTESPAPPAQDSGGKKGGGGIMSMVGGMAKGGFANYLAGGGVPGKSEVAGNSAKNDKVPALLSPGEVVIDKETLADKGPIGKAARTVAQHIEERNNGGDTEDASPKAQEFMKHLKPQKKGYGGVINARKAKC